MPELVGNLLVAQSGGPTAVINASVAGVVQEAGRHGCIEEIYGGLNGILGILNEDLVDLNDEKARAIEGLKYTPGAALGTCRYKVDFKKKPEQAAKDMDRLFEVFQAHNIRYFFYIGGNDSQDTSLKIHEEAAKRAYEMRIIGVPKTIDNDLPHTDNCPGYGSVIKYNATTVMEVGLDVASMATDDGSCCIIEVMGRSAGWIAAGTVLAQRGAMVEIVREPTINATLHWRTGLQPLADIANVEHFIPRDWVSEDGFLPNEKFIEYARPLIEGEVKIPFDGGLPKYVTLEKSK